MDVVVSRKSSSIVHMAVPRVGGVVGFMMMGSPVALLITTAVLHSLLAFSSLKLASLLSSSSGSGSSPWVVVVSAQQQSADGEFSSSSSEFKLPRVNHPSTATNTEALVPRAFGAQNAQTIQPLTSSVQTNSEAYTKTHVPTIVVFNADTKHTTLAVLDDICETHGVDLVNDERKVVTIGATKEQRVTPVDQACHMPEVCKHIFRTDMLGVSGNFSQAQLDKLVKCLPDGAIDYVEPDERVFKMEDHDDWKPGGRMFPIDNTTKHLLLPRHHHHIRRRRRRQRRHLLMKEDMEEEEEDEKKEKGDSELRQVLMMAAARVETEEDHISLLAHISRDAKRSFSSSDFERVQAMSSRPQPGNSIPTQKASAGEEVAFTQCTSCAGFGNLTAQQLNDADLDGAKAQSLHLALWNLDRADQRSLPLDGEYHYGNDANAGTGRGVTIYVIDSGLNKNHQEFAPWTLEEQERDDAGTGRMMEEEEEKRAGTDGTGKGSSSPQTTKRWRRRARRGPDYVDDDEDNSDCDGHGTHVAATAVGRSVGVAKGANVVGVRVLGCDGSGSISDVIAGLDWVAAHHRKPAVATLSLGIAVGRWSRALEDAVKRLVTVHGVVVVVASGNSGVDSCAVAPGNVAVPIAVAASDFSGKFAPPDIERSVESLYRWSNTGACVDLLAPGVDIYSACAGAGRCNVVAPDSYTWASGTSMAVPLVAGAAALYLEQHPRATPEEVKSALLRSSTDDRIRSPYLLASTPNRILYMGFLFS